MKNTKLTVVVIVAFLLLLGIYLIRSGQEEQAEAPQSTEQVTNLVPKPSQANKIIGGQIVVKFKSNMTETQINQYLQPYQAKIIKKIDKIDRYIIQVPAGQEAAILKKLSQDQLIEDAEPDYEIHANSKPNDPLYSSQWGLVNTGQTIKSQAGTAGSDVKAETAWNVTRGNGIKVAVIDSGINLNHPDFAGQIVAQRAYISDSVEDDYGHGTHVAGAIAALGNNAQGITGVCPECKLLVAKVLNDEGSGSSTNVAAAMIWAADQGAKVINISAGGKNSTQTMEEAVNYVNAKGAIVVCSAGNEGDTAMTYPSAIASVVSVAAIDNRDLLASFSTRGAWVKVAAPGVNMMSTFPTHAFNLQTANPTPLNTINDYLSGTSMAAPIVSGVLGLIWASPYGSSNTAVIQRLYSTADQTPGTGTYWTYGRINAAKAVGADAITPTSEPTEITPTALPTQAITATPPVSAIPTFTCLGACVTISPSPVPTNTPTPAPAKSAGPPASIPASGLPDINTIIETVFQNKSCPTSNSSGLISSFHNRGGDRGGNRGGGKSRGKNYNKGGKNNNRGGGYKQGGTPSQQTNCQKNGLLEQIAKLLTQLLAILFGTPQPAPAPAPAPTPTGACKSRPPCLDDPTNACLLPEPAEGWCPTTPTPQLSCTPRPACLDGEPACQIPEPAEGWCPTASPTQACAQAITRASNPKTKECKEFPTSCLPSPWVPDNSCVIPNASLKGD